MGRPRSNLTPSQAAAHLGVSVKALRIYERFGLLEPGRTAAGWRVYSPDDLTRAEDVVLLRGLGVSLARMGCVLDGNPLDLDGALADHEVTLKRQARRIAVALDKVRRLRADGFRGREPTSADVAAALADGPSAKSGFELPWPWGGEWFDLRDIRPLTFITGPLGSGKTLLAKCLAETLPGAVFLGLDRLSDATIPDRLSQDADLAERVERALAWLTDDGAERSEALLALVVALETSPAAFLVIDMVEQGLSGDSQKALVSFLRSRIGRRPTLFLMTRSSSILDLDTIDPDEAVIVCPANHSAPLRVSIDPRGRGYEAALTCLGPPGVRARTAGIALQTEAAV